MARRTSKDMGALPWANSAGNPASGMLNSLNNLTPMGGFGPSINVPQLPGVPQPGQRRSGQRRQTRQERRAQERVSLNMGPFSMSAAGQNPGNTLGQAIGTGVSAFQQMKGFSTGCEILKDTVKQYVGVKCALAEYKGKKRIDQNYKAKDETNKPEDPPREHQPLRPKQYVPVAPMNYIEKRRLFGSAIHSGENVVLIAPKAIGKTGFCMQIAAAVAEGKPTGLWPTYEDGICKPQRVLYYDCELTDSDMFDRYYRYGYSFPANFERYDQTQFKNADDILADLEWKVKNELADGDDAAVFIDNITKALKTEQVSEINRFNDKVDEIYKLANGRGITLTLISIVHVLTGEYRPGAPITLKEAAGGSNLTNFKSSIIVLEQPRNAKNIVLVKVLNCRSEPEPNNVCVLRRVGKNEGTHYHFEHVGEMEEDAALCGELPESATLTKAERELKEALEMKAFIEEGHTQEETAEKFHCCRRTLNNRLNLLKRQNKDDYDTEGDV